MNHILNRRVLRTGPGVGSVSLESIFAVGFLLIPAAALLSQLPSWVAVGHAAQTAATEAARQVVLADDIPSAVTAARATARQVITAHGLNLDQLIEVAVEADPPGPLQPGQRVTVTITVQGNPIAVPGLGGVGKPFRASRSATERVDDYRGFPP